MALSVSTPCIKVCVIEPGAGLCSGCGRTLDEIARWGSMGEPERIAIMKVLPNRLASLGKGAPRENAVE